jgi:tellurite resistance protein
MEAKYARTGTDHVVTTSSVLGPTSLKLDLTVGDVRRQILRMRTPYEALASDQAVRDRFARELAAGGLVEHGLREAVAAAASRMWDWFGALLEDSVRSEPAPGTPDRVRSTLLRRLLLQFVLLAAEIERHLGRIATRNAPAWTDPQSSADLFVITIARFYEQDRDYNFWHIDQIVRTEFDPTCVRLAELLSSAHDRCGLPADPLESHVAMRNREELAPLFTQDLALSADDATAIVAALRDIAESDGVHDDELAMITSFVEQIDADLGALEPTKIGPMTPAKLAAKLRDPTLRTVAVQCAVLLALADGAISDKERARVLEYAQALEVPRDRYQQIERTLTEWVKSGQLEPIL